jgi:hypothetical protein
MKLIVFDGGELDLARIFCSKDYDMESYAKREVVVSILFIIRDILLKVGAFNGWKR